MAAGRVNGRNAESSLMSSVRWSLGFLANEGLSDDAPASGDSTHAISVRPDEASEDATRLPADNVSSLMGFGNSLAKKDLGDLSCMRWTGGFCRLYKCSSDRGPVECIEGKCVCKDGCATAKGQCQKEKGEWLGQFAIKFAYPYDANKPYIGLGADGSSLIKGLGPSVQQFLGSSSDAAPAWKIALTPDQYVRFESVAKPGLVMSIHNSRRRIAKQVAPDRVPEASFLQLGSNPSSGDFSERRSDSSGDAGFEDLSDVSKTFALGSLPELFPISSIYENMVDRSEKASTAEEAVGHVSKLEESVGRSQPEPLNLIHDSDDEWPVVVPFIESSPADATFRIRQTAKNGGGLEIWDPQTGHALSTRPALTNPEYASTDKAADQGISECDTFGFSNCEGRQLVEFEPELPARASPVVPHDIIKEIDTVMPWEVWLIGMLVCIVCCCCGVPVPGTDYNTHQWVMIGLGQLTGKGAYSGAEQLAHPDYNSSQPWKGTSAGIRTEGVDRWARGSRKD